MSDPKAPSTQESTADIMQALTQYLPGYMQVQNSQVLPQAQTQLEAAKVISPEYAKLMSDLYNTYGVSLAETGSKVDAASRKASAAADLDILKTSGGDLAKEAVKVDRQLNPEYYSTRELESKKLGELLSSINLNDANPEAERLVNQESYRSGNAVTPNATSTVANALSFGSKLDQRRDTLGKVLNTATNFLQPSQGQFNPVVTALGRPSTNSGSSQFTGVKDPSSQAYQSGNQLLGNITSTKQQENEINANRRDALDRVSQVMGSVSI